jgi:hypothetical protein
MNFMNFINSQEMPENIINDINDQQNNYPKYNKYEKLFDTKNYLKNSNNVKISRKVNANKAFIKQPWMGKSKY